MSYRQPPPQQYGNPASSAGAPGSQYGGPDPSSHDGGYGNPDPYAQQQAQDQYGQDQHSAQYHGEEQQQSGTQMQGEAQPNGAADAGGHAADGHKAGANTTNGPGANAKKRHPLEHLKEDKNHNDMMVRVHFSFIGLSIQDLLGCTCVSYRRRALADNTFCFP